MKELPLSGISIATVDRLGNFYFILPNGVMQKYDPDGTLLAETKTSLLPLNLVEPWNPLKIFTFSNQSRYYSWIDHHLEVLERNELDPSLSITPRLVCPANEVNKAWILDEADFTLKRVNLITNQIEVESKIENEWAESTNDFVFMREYQNRIFLLDKKKGILILNNLGKTISSIKVIGLSFFNFMGEELCYRNGGDIFLTDLYTGTSRKLTSLENADQIVSTIITDERLVVVNKSNVIIYSLQN